MTVGRVIFIIMAVFAVLGGLDRIIGSRFGLGKAFEKGLYTMGPLAMTMTGMIVLSPLLAKLLSPVVVPVYQFFGADPAMFAGSFLACDMGGEPLAAQLAGSPEAATLGGIITASMLGVTVTFTLPVAMGVISKDDRPYAAKGILCGLVTVPLGVFVGGLILGMPLLELLKNLIPIVLLSALIALGLWLLEHVLIVVFTWFGRLMTALSIIGLLLALVEKLTGWTAIKGLAPVGDAILIVGEIALMLAGAFPLMALITRLLRPLLLRIGRRVEMKEESVMGLLSSSVNSIATFDAVGNMDERGKVINMAFAVSGAFVFGDHLAFTAGVAPHAILALILGKLAAGVTAVALAILLTRPRKKDSKRKKSTEAPSKSLDNKEEFNRV